MLLKIIINQNYKGFILRLIAKRFELNTKLKAR